MKEIICKRKSTRAFTDIPIDDIVKAKIQEFIKTIKPLYPQIRISLEIVESGDIKTLMPWKTPQFIAIFSEEKDGARENAGFMGQQLDLYLQSIGLGACWIGMGYYDPRDESEKERADGLKSMIVIAFGNAKGNIYRNGAADFRRKALEEIMDTADERLEPARLAPSATNDQPWYFVHEEDAIHAYCIVHGPIKRRTLAKMNRIDMGIALAHMYVSNPDTFRFFIVDDPKKVEGYYYMGSFTV